MQITEQDEIWRAPTTVDVEVTGLDKMLHSSPSALRHSPSRLAMLANVMAGMMYVGAITC
jgi:hypothetical protein